MKNNSVHGIPSVAKGVSIFSGAILSVICMYVGIAAMSANLYSQQASDIGTQPTRGAGDTGLSTLMRDEFKYDPEAKARADAEASNKAIAPHGTTSVRSGETPDASAAGSSTNHSNANAKEDIVEMEPFIVSAKRDRAIQKQIDRLDTLIAKGERHVEPSTLDTVLNNPKINIPFLMAGGYSYKVRSNIVKGQIDEMRFLRQILVYMQAAKTLAEYRRYENMANSMGVSVRISLPKFEDNEASRKQPDSAGAQPGDTKTDASAAAGDASSGRSAHDGTEAVRPPATATQTGEVTLPTAQKPK